LDTRTVSPQGVDNATELLAYARERRDAENYIYAESLCRRVIEMGDASAYAHELLGTILQAQDRVAEAVDSFQEAVRLEPGNAEAFQLLSIALAELGCMTEAIAAVRASLLLRPHHAGALYHLAELKEFYPGDPDLGMLEAASADLDDIDQHDAVFLCFALAKAYDDLGEYNRSFGYLERANAIKHARSGYDVEDDLRLMREIAEVFDKPLVNRFSGAGSRSDLPVLIVGMPRTGTTLVEQILASHPAVHGAGEPTHLEELALAISLSDQQRAGFPRGVLHLGAAELNLFGEAYVAQLRRLAPSAVRVIDKNPFNFRYLGLARVIVPGARVIHCSRDPLDTCLSCYRANLKWMDVACDLGDLGRYYRAYEDLMNHWRAVLPPDSILEVAYETLVDDLECQARRIVAHCGLDWDPACLDFHASGRQVRTASFAQVRRPMYRGALARWRRYEAHLAPLVAALGSREVRRTGATKH
jgi:tetratricopeptide (TPR) repeat protein